MAILKEAVGRRKTAIATVKIRKGKGRIFINNRISKDYLGNRAALEMMILQPLELTNNAGAYDLIVKAVGGGIASQAGAIRHGLSKALLALNAENKSVLKENGLLTRDSRIKERKKYGRKRARKRFQFSKR